MVWTSLDLFFLLGGLVVFRQWAYSLVVQLVVSCDGFQAFCYWFCGLLLSGLHSYQQVVFKGFFVVVFELCVNDYKWWFILWFFSGLIERYALVVLQFYCSGFMVGCYCGLYICLSIV